ncbi:MAG: TonB-dependent receptor [Chromatiales bacterium]|nr:TonB-dependent receptor [Chromatiales bacterium]
MKKTACMLLFCSAGVQAADNNLPTISVESTRLSDVSGEEVKSADLAEALVKKAPSISLVRRSGIANDIILRGQKKDNINILIDGGKIYGACPNRMDPPTSHVVTNQIADIEIVEGPYDVENFGTLSGSVKVNTKKPEEGFHGDVNLNAGSWGYRKASATLSGGNERIRMLISASTETSDQYEDGDGNNFAEQIENHAPMMPAVHYKDNFRNLDAYEKRTFLGKVIFNLTDNQDLMLSYTANRSDDILYPSSKMDALFDDSDLFNLAYTARNLGRYSKRLDVQIYDSQVDHPMSTLYRNSSGPDSANEVIHSLDTQITGLKVKNAFDLNPDTELTIGVDGSRRNWDGLFIGKGSKAMLTGKVSIPDVDTDNRALFVEMNKQIGALNLQAGARYDNTSIDPDSSSGLNDNDYTALSAYLYGNYELDQSTSVFAGVGRSSRVPDARELYFTNTMGVMVGTPDLDQTHNVEIDLGVEKNFNDLTVKGKVFHSWLSDFIHFNASKMMMGNAFENVDARIYGFQLSGSYFMTDDIYLDFGVAAQRGRKDNPLTGQTDRDLAEIPPLKANLALNYDYAPDSSARVEVIAADAWDTFDSDNGEQELDGYAVVNLKLDHAVTDNFSITAGIDNLFDRTYAVSNTFQDLTLITAGGDIMLLNEPGRYYYLNVNYHF